MFSAGEPTYYEILSKAGFQRKVILGKAIKVF